MRTCTLSFAGRTGPCEWNLDGERLVLQPSGGAPLPVALAEVAGLSGDGYSLDLRLGATSLSLSKLGADGPALKETLERTWPPLRAGALRLSGTGEPLQFAGRADDGRGPVPCLLLLYSDLLAVFREGEDARPLFVSLQKEVRHDDGAYTVTFEAWDGERAVFSHMGGATEAFARALEAARGGLALEAADALAAGLPSLGSFPRATLASTWLPGRLLPIPELDSTAPGTTTALLVSWVAASPRGREGKLLLEGAAPEDAFFAYTRPGSGGASEEAEAVVDSAPETGAGEDGAGAAPPPLAEGLWPLWLLVRRGDSWFLEALGETDRATYRFSGGGEVPALCSRLLCAPQFSREALYQPVEKLVGAKAAFAIPSRDLPFLKELRARFKGRVLHTGPAAWKRGIGL